MSNLFFYTQEELNRYVLELIIRVQGLLLDCYRGMGVEKAWEFLLSTPFLDTYPCSVSIEALYRARSELAYVALEKQLNFSFSWQNLPKKPLRVGVYLQYLSASTESRATLPYVQSLKDYGFEVVLFFPKESDISSGFAQKFLNLATKVCALENDIHFQVEAMRSEELHCLFFANNTTAVMNNAFLLAMHRIAFLQVVHFCQPHSTFIPNIDAFVLGEDLPIDFEKHVFSEQILSVHGSGIRFAAVEEAVLPSQEWNLSLLGIPENAKVFVSGANLYKLSPQARETFVRLLSYDTDTYLLLYPFGPSWSQNYPTEEFIFSMRNLFQQYGVDLNRCRILPTLKTQGDVLEILKLCTVYLDSFPHSGATSLLDPLSVNLPCVCLEGKSLISTQGGGLLKELGLEEFVVNHEDNFIHKARKFIENKEYYDECRNKIAQNMRHCKIYEYKDMTTSLGMNLEKLYTKKLERELRN